MVKKIGQSTSTSYGLKVAATNKYILARAWDYGFSTDPADGYKIREFQLRDDPVMVTKTLSAAKKLHSLLPQKLEEILDDYQHSQQRAYIELSNNKHIREVQWFENRVKYWQDQCAIIEAVMNSLIQIMEFVTVTSKTEKIVP